MNKLEEEIYESLLKYEGIFGIESSNPITACICESHTKIVYQVALKWIEKALKSGSAETFRYSSRYSKGDQYFYIKKWMEENGLLEPDTIIASNGLISTGE